jgi:hypothetical protein
MAAPKSRGSTFLAIKGAGLKSTRPISRSLRCSTTRRIWPEPRSNLSWTGASCETCACSSTSPRKIGRRLGGCASCRRPASLRPTFEIYAELKQACIQEQGLCRSPSKGSRGILKQSYNQSEEPPHSRAVFRLNTRLSSRGANQLTENTNDAYRSPNARSCTLQSPSSSAAHEQRKVGHRAGPNWTNARSVAHGARWGPGADADDTGWREGSCSGCRPEKSRSRRPEKDEVSESVPVAVPCVHRPQACCYMQHA